MRTIRSLIGESMRVRQSYAQAEAIAWPHLELGDRFKRARALLCLRNDSIASKRDADMLSASSTQKAPCTVRSLM